MCFLQNLVENCRQQYVWHLNLILCTSSRSEAYSVSAKETKTEHLPKFPSENTIHVTIAAGQEECLEDRLLSFTFSGLRRVILLLFPIFYISRAFESKSWSFTTGFSTFDRSTWHHHKLYTPPLVDVRQSVCLCEAHWIYLQIQTGESVIFRKSVC